MHFLTLKLSVMEPGIGLMIWSLFSLCSLLLMVVAVNDLIKGHFKDTSLKVAWLVAVLFVPVLGPLLYFKFGKKQKLGIN